MTNQTVAKVTLHNNTGNSDKIYECVVVRSGDLYLVNTQNGRRGGSMTPRTKTTQPVSLEAAMKIYEGLIKEKRANNNIALPLICPQSKPADSRRTTLAWIPPFFRLPGTPHVVQTSSRCHRRSSAPLTLPAGGTHTLSRAFWPTPRCSRRSCQPVISTKPMMTSHTAIRADHVGGHVAMAPVLYFPNWPIPAESRKRFQPWACTFHTDDGGPRQFVAFGGHAGMLDAVYALLGPLLMRMHGGLFEKLAERVDFELDNTPLQAARLEVVADALDEFTRSATFEVDCYLVGVDPLKARLHLETMRTAIGNGRAIVL